MNSKLRILLGLAGSVFGLAAPLPAQESPALRVDITQITVVQTPGSVGGVSMMDSGLGYESDPVITFIGDGTGATAVPIRTGSTISGIVVTNGGSGYTQPPLVILTGGEPASDRPFSPATAASFLTGTVFDPPNESYGPAGRPINITARALGTNTVESYTYRFFVNGVPIGESPVIGPPTAATYPQFVPPRPGVYYFSVTATDGMTTVSSPAVRYFATGTSITSPLDNTLVPVGSSVTIKADATPQAGFIKQIEFFLNGTQSLGVDSTAPYSINYTPVAAAGTALSITAVATTNDNVQMTASAPVVLNVVAAVGTPPTVALATPLDGAVLPVPNGSPIPISIVANDSDGRVERVEIYVDGVLHDSDFTFPYSSAWSPVSVGEYQLSALVYDDKNNVVASPVHLVYISAPPTVSITTPAAGTTVGAGNPTIITANATDSDGEVLTVDFYADSTYIGSDATSPYSVAWVPSGDGAVVITARAIDNVGLSTVSDGRSLTVTGGGGGGGGSGGGGGGSGGVVIGAAPTTSITAPVAGTNLPVNAPVTISANASDTDGNITNVQFLVGSTVIGSDATYPYSVTWTPTSLGNYVITSRATDNDANIVSSAAVSVTVADLSPSLPTVAISFPTPSTSVAIGTAVNVTAAASDVDGYVASVQFYLNGQPLGAPDTVAPFATSWTPTAAGSYTLSARATDSTGNQATSIPVVIVIGSDFGPSVTLTSPLNNTFVSAGTPVTLTANASDADGSITSVAFLVNGVLAANATSAPYTGTWTPGAAGTYSIVAYATDNSGNVAASNAVTVTASGNSSPTVRITAPAAGSSVQLGTTAVVRATATDPNGTISRVQFYANGVPIGSGTTGTGGYMVNWTPASAGVYRLVAIASDNGGGSSQSADVLVAVVDPFEGEIDTVYGGKDFGLYLAGGEVGRFTLVNQGNRSATLIGYSTSGEPKVYFYRGMDVDTGGMVQLRNGASTIVSGTINPAGVSGTFDGGRVNFSGPVAFGSSAYRGPAGLLTGSVSGRSSSILTGIIGGDGALTLHVKDGTNEDAGAGALNSSGEFAINMVKGTSATGRIDPATGFLTVTLSNGPITGSGTAAFAGASPASDGFLSNLSTRGLVGSGEKMLIAGFFVAGTQPKQVLVRASGPALLGLGVNGVVADPALTVFNSVGAQVSGGYNNNWGGHPAIAAAAAKVGGFPWPDNSLDAAVLLTLNPGAYSAQVAGIGGSAGVALVEIYDADTLEPFSRRKLMNVSTRGEVGTGEKILIAGINVTGTAPKRVLIRGLGPALVGQGVSGAVSDPRLQIFKGQTVIRENDDWHLGNDPEQIAAASADVAAYALPAAGSKDAAILITLPPGTYTAQVSGAGGATGIALIEVYEVE